MAANEPKTPGKETDEKDEQNDNSPDPVDQAFKKRFKLLEALGSGSFGEVYNGYDREGKMYVAIKIERLNPAKRSGSLEKEWARYAEIALRLDAKTLANLPELSEHGTAKCFGFFRTKKKSFLVMQKLGPSLETLFNKCKRRFSLKTVCQIAIQMIDRIQMIHAAQMIHRDIKPDNFVIGCAGDPKVAMNFIRIIDFGLSKDYIQANGRHIEVALDKDLVGTVRYVSIRVHEGVEQSRRDDIESIGHVLIYFLTRGLPWMGINAAENLPERQKVKVRYKLVGEKKKELGIDGLCKGLPPQFRRYMQYARNEMTFEERPDYGFLRALFSQVIVNEGFCQDERYDWDELEDESHEHVRDQSSTNQPAGGSPRT